MRTDKEKMRAYPHGTVPGMAHFAGTGPAGRTCGECRFLVKVPRGNNQRCEKYRQMMDEYGAVNIPETTPACKYFTEPTPWKP